MIREAISAGWAVLDALFAETAAQWARIGWGPRSDERVGREIEARLVVRIRGRRRDLASGDFHWCGGPSRDPEEAYCCDCWELRLEDQHDDLSLLRAIRQRRRARLGRLHSASGGVTGPSVGQRDREPSWPESASDTRPAIAINHRNHTEEEVSRGV